MKEYRSKHPGDINRWIEKVIDSCVTVKQLETARNLVHYFHRSLEKSQRALFYRDLAKILDDKFFTLVEENLKKTQSGENFHNVG